MRFERTKNSVATFFSSILYQIVNLILPFVVRTVVIYTIGAEYLGLNSLLTSILQVLSVADLGFTGAVTFCLYKPVAEDNHKIICACIAYLRKVYLIISGIILTVGLLLIPFFPFLIKGDYPSDVNIYILYLIFLFNTISSYLFFAYKGVLLQVYQKGSINNVVTMLVELVRCILQIIVLVFFKAYYAYVLLLPIGTIAIHIINNIYVCKKYPWCTPKGKLPEETIKIIRTKIAFLFGHKVAATLTNSIDNIVISAYIGLVAIAIYGNYSLITGAIVGVTVGLYGALRPTIGNYMQTESIEENHKLFRSMYFLCAWWDIWCTTCMLCLFQPFMEIWVGRGYMLDTKTVVMIVLFFYATVSRQFFASLYVEIMGLWNKTLIRQIVAAVVNLVLDLLLGKYYGISGIVFASFFSTMFISYPMDIYTVYKYVLAKNIKEGIFRACITFIIMVAIVLLTYGVCVLIPINGIPLLFVRVLICIIFPNLIGIIVFRKSAEFRYIWNHLRMLKIKKG